MSSFEFIRATFEIKLDQISSFETQMNSNDLILKGLFSKQFILDTIEFVCAHLRHVWVHLSLKWSNFFKNWVHLRRKWTQSWRKWAQTNSIVSQMNSNLVLVFCFILKNYLCKNPHSRNIIFILVFILSQQVNYHCRKRKNLLKIILTFICFRL